MTTPGVINLFMRSGEAYLNAPLEGQAAERKHFLPYLSDGTGDVHPGGAQACLDAGKFGLHSRILAHWQREAARGLFSCEGEESIGHGARNTERNRGEAGGEQGIRRVEVEGPGKRRSVG